MAVANTEQTCQQLNTSINKISTDKFSEIEFDAVRRTLLPGSNSSEQRLDYHDDIIHIKNGPFDLDVINVEVEKIIQACDTIFKDSGMPPAKPEFITNLAFKTNRETNERELIGYGYILFADRRITKILIGFDLDGEIRAEVDDDDFEVDMTMSWSDITIACNNKANEINVNLLTPLVYFKPLYINTDELKDIYRRITIDTAKHDGTYVDGMEANIVVPECYHITLSPFRIKKVDDKYDSDKLICPVFPIDVSIAKLRSQVLSFTTNPNKSHIVREKDVNYHRLYPYINNVDNHDGKTRTVVIYFDPSTQDAQKALNFIRTYFIDDKNGNTVKLYFNYRKNGINPFSSGMNEPQPGSGVIEDKEGGLSVDYNMKRDTSNPKRGGGKPFGRGRGRSSGSSSNKPTRGQQPSYQVKKDDSHGNTIIFNGKSSNNASNNNWRVKKDSVSDKKPTYQSNRNDNSSNSGWRQNVKSKKTPYIKPLAKNSDLFNTLAE